MIEDFELTRIIVPLLEWYRENKRALPWRENQDAYGVWVSEIMLQQTRVEAVIPYYKRFMQALPTISSLAECGENQLLKLWEGLGYYNRVRNMQIAARTIEQDYGGVFPGSYEQMIQLKGIGSYTGGAIASIAYGEPVPAVDGNVLRIIARVCGDDWDIAKQATKKRTEGYLREIMPKKMPGDFNQALMELGATVCVPNGEPNCSRCPWNTMCRTHELEAYADYPVKKKPEKRKIEERTVLLIKRGDEILLIKRPEKGLLSGLFEFPNRKGYLSRDEAVEEVRKLCLHPLRIMELADSKHIFSHIEWHMKGYLIRVDDLDCVSQQLLFASVKDVEEKYTIPTAFKRYTAYMKIRLGNERFKGEEIL
ncbi:MAG: A/G-specific adenine glycosylase [Lachnospiraceae bacterium]